MSMFKYPNIISYNVTNWQQAKKFYGVTLGLPVAAFINDETGWMEFGEKDSVHLAIGQWRGPGPMPPKDGGGMAIFSVEDAFKAVEELRRRGVRTDDVQVIPGMVAFATFYDPDGNRLQVAGPPPNAK